MRTKKSHAAVATLAVTGLVAAVGASIDTTPGAQAAPSPKKPVTYIVELAQAPIATYTGGTAGIPASKPAPGKKVDVRSANARAYAQHIEATQNRVLAEAGVSASAKESTYKVAFNGFAVALTPEQVEALRGDSQVKNIWKNEIRETVMTDTPDYLGMTGPNGVWAKELRGQANAGKGIIIGDIDTGIDSHHPFFAPIPGQVKDPDFKGVCDKGADPNFTCSTKIIGARYYGAEYGNYIDPAEIVAPTDRNGHGSHTAGTAAGNADVKANINGNELGAASGMAPAAQIAVYKALWVNGDKASGTSAGLVKAIDDAVADGVDVINYSISGSLTSVISPEAIAQLNATEAGVFFAAAAGNEGDSGGPSTVNHNGPWTMTVAAGTHNRPSMSKKVTLGNGASYTGQGVGAAVGPAPLIHAKKAVAEGADPALAALCLSDGDEAADGVQPTLDPAKIKGKIVICDRGNNARTDKSLAVKAAGGVGMILANVAPDQTINMDYHSVPSIHVNNVDGDAIRAYENSDAQPTATLSAGTPMTKPDAPQVAQFSSYGPALAGGGDLLKPDIMAPGQDIISATHAGKTGAPEWEMMSGTSMATPHIAGLAALIRQRHPEWTPSMIKSAMMTTARVTSNAGKPIMRGDREANALDYGAGEIVPARMFDPGLVYAAGLQDWKAYACSILQWQETQDAAACPKNLADPSDINYPTIAVGDLAGKQTVTRTVTNVSSGWQYFRAKVAAPAGTKVTVFPSSFVLGRNRTQKFTVTIERTTAEIGKYTFGSLTWDNGGRYKVRSNIAVRPTAYSAPNRVSGAGSNGSATFRFMSATKGTVKTDVDGLQAPEQVAVSGAAKPDPEDTKDIVSTIDVAAGTRALRVATYKDESSYTDLDLALYRVEADGKRTQVGYSGNGGSTEEILVPAPAAGKYEVAVDIYSNEQKGNTTLNIWKLGDAQSPTTTVTPSTFTAKPGAAQQVTVKWAGLPFAKHWFGGVNFNQNGKTLGTTYLTVES